MYTCIRTALTFSTTKRKEWISPFRKKKKGGHRHFVVSKWTTLFPLRREGEEKTALGDLRDVRRGRVFHTNF